MTIKEDFSLFQYDFYTTRGFKFYSFEQIDNLQGYKNHRHQLYCLKEKKIEILFDVEDGEKYRKTTFKQLNKEELVAYNRYYYSFHDGETKDLSKQCYFDFFKANPKKSKEILNHCSTFTSHNLSDVYFELFDIFDKVTVLGFLDKCLASNFRLSNDINNIQQKIKPFHFTEQENLLFWHTYLKNRKQELNKPEQSHRYSQFLLKEFQRDESILKVFFPYFKRLESEFKEVEFSFVENEKFKTTTIMVNLAKMLKGFNISDWKENKYEELMDELTPGIATFFKVPYHEATYINKSKRHYRMLFSHTEENLISKEKVETIIKDFFNHLKNNYNTKYTKEQMQTWLYQNSLDKILPHHGDIKPLKRKI